MPLLITFNSDKHKEIVLRCAREKLVGTRYRMSRNYPEEIRNARRKLGTKFREARDKGATNVYIAFPAKLIADGVVISDLFPDWSRILQSNRPERETTSVSNAAESGTGGARAKANR